MIVYFPCRQTDRQTDRDRQSSSCLKLPSSRVQGTSCSYGNRNCIF